MTSRKCSARDFIFKEKIGHGSYSTVYKAYDKRNIKRVFAIKVCSKAHIIKERKVKYVTIEKNTLNLLAKGNHPGIVKLYYTFHDEQNLYFVLDFASGGELLSLLHKYGTFNELWSKHFTVQLIDTINYIHSQGVIHRDLKPENVLLNKAGLLMITDFGAALSPNTDDNKDTNNNADKQITSASSFVGTAEYVSPELLLHNQCCFGSDIWALGCMIYQFFEGHPPFRGENELKTFEKIVSLDYLWNGPQNIIEERIKQGIPSVVISLVKRILVIDTRKRLSLNDIKSDIWFNDINWNDKKSIWKGIWEIQQDEMSTKSPKVISPLGNKTTHNSNNFNSNLYHRMIPNRQLHIIDTPVKSIEITKQKKKKPTKVSNTTSSIVEWRKKLGISSTHVNNKSQIVDMTTDIDNIGSDLIIPTQAATKSNTNNNTIKVSSITKTNKVSSISQQKTIKNTNYINNIKNETTVVDSSITSRKVPTLNANPHNLTNNNNNNINNNSIIINNLPIKTTIKHDTTHTPFPPQNPNNSLKLSTAKLSKLNILKQGYINLHEIPYKQNGPGMSLISYNQIDNDSITTFVTSYQNDLKTASGNLNLLILKKNGSLYHCNIQIINGVETKISEEHFMVNISDSDLSVYDFEFDEVTKSGFLILEKYKESIWFISLPESNKLDREQNINENETWVDCFFKARQLIEEPSNDEMSNDTNNLTNKLENITIIDKSSPPKIEPAVTINNSTKILTPTPLQSPNLIKKKSKFKATSQLNPPFVLKDSNYSSKKKSNSVQTDETSNCVPLSSMRMPKQRQISNSSSNSNNHNYNKSMTTTQPYNIDHHIKTTSTISTSLHDNTTNKHKMPSSPASSSSPSSPFLLAHMQFNENNRRNLSPHLKSKSFLSSSSSNTHNSSNNSNNSHHATLNSPTSNTKKYNAPKNMVITSSRYEVIHTLSSQSISDQTVASSGASAAFKSLQRKKLNNNTR